MEEPSIEKAAQLLCEARLSQERLAGLPDGLRPVDQAEAYAIQEALHAKLEAAGRGPLVGYKIGCTTPVMQEYLGIPSPCAAGVFASGVHANGVTVRAADYRRIGIECEIAVRLGRDIDGDGPFTAGTVADAVAETMAAIEIVDDRYADWRTTDTPTLIADDFFAAGCVLGAPVKDAGDPATFTGTTTINGVEVGRGVGRDVMGHPYNALAWIASSLAERGMPLRKGEIVLLGSLVETKWLEAGDHAVIEVDGLGKVEMRVA
jgi:2-keto-4-pentenoate hydratase